MNRIGKSAVQIAILCGLAFLSNFLVAQFSLPLPGSVVGIVLLFGLLQLRILRLEWIEQCAGSLDGRQVVDVGCGGGILSEAMARYASTPDAEKPHF